MITCRHAAELASRALDEPLGLRQRLALRFHRMVCGLCRRFGHQIRLIHRDAVDYFHETKKTPKATLSDTAKERIIRQLKASEYQS
jgi:hypothetical protein